MKLIANRGMEWILILGMAAVPAAAQNQAQAPTPAGPQTSAPSTSLGSYARQIRKDPGTTAKPKVYDNDNLPTDDKLSVVGPEPTAPVNGASADSKPDDSAKPAADGKTATGDKPTDDAAKQAAWKQWSDKIKAQQGQIDLSARELDVLQKEYQLRAAAMYGDVGNRLRNSTDWDKQDAEYKQKIADKQKALDDAKQALESMQEDARKAGVPSAMREP
ncbi:MAG TPA: hypothetical protein VMD76_02320 [Candidatus Sulfotelmatobacter sp.]|nr:hypothetical protein [Candidatus Sulfotelmatobacter sp.]